MLATAIFDRFVHHCSFITIERESYRMKEQKWITYPNRRGKRKKDNTPKISDTAAENAEAMRQHNLIIVGTSPISMVYPRKIIEELSPIFGGLFY